MTLFPDDITAPTTSPLLDTAHHQATRRAMRVRITNALREIETVYRVVSQSADATDSGLLVRVRPDMPRRVRPDVPSLAG